jgi:dephospho-CoA kinase
MRVVITFLMADTGKFKSLPQQLVIEANIVMFVIGLTGGIASGKSTVSSFLREAGIPVICADKIAREAVKAGSPSLRKIRALFGDEVIDKEGNLDRKAVGRIVFADETKRKSLESIVHPRVAEETDRILSELEKQGNSIVVVDVPLLYEAGWDRRFDLVIVVYVPRDCQEERLIRRDRITREEAAERISAQIPISKKKELADRIVDNTGEIAHTRSQVQRLAEQLRTLAQQKFKQLNR